MAALLELSGKKRFELQERTTIGRHPLSEICLTDGMVSLCHAEVRRTPDGKYAIVDVGSRHGTYVGSKRVTEAPLADGDEILVGPIRLRFEDKPVIKAGDDEVARLRAMVELSRAIGVEHDLHRLGERILETAFQLLRADRGAIMLVSPKTKRAFLTVSRSRSGTNADVVFSTSIVSEIMSRKAGLITSQADVDSRFSRTESIIGQGIRSVMYVPLLYQDDLLGVMHLDSMAAVNVFAARDLELFSAIGSQAAMAVQNALLVKQVQDVVAAEKRRLEGVLESLPLGVMLLNADRQIELSNAWAKERAHLFSPAPTPTRGRFGTMELDRIVASATATEIHAGNPRRTFTVSSNAFSDFGETVVVIRDVTEEREREAKSAHKERLALIGQLAGGVAHDFNNLLMVILNYAGFVEAAVADPEVRDDVGQIRLAAQRAAELIRQLLAFSRREAVKPKVLDIGELIAGAEKMLRRTLGELVQFQAHTAPDVPRILVDPTKLEQVLINLTVNARDAMPDGGVVSVEVEGVTLDEEAAQDEGLAPGRYAHLRVSDTGTGMAPEVMARVFEPFFTTKEQGKGTGLGLATVYGVVTQAGGIVTVRSELGVGTTFHVYFPATSRLPEAEGGSGLLLGVGGKETILLAEDEEAVRRLTKRILVSAGYSVLEAADGPEAMALAARHEGQIDLLVTDLVMPGMSGRELAQKLLAERRGLSVLYISGYFGESAPGALPLSFLPKPFTQDELLARVRDALGGARMVR